MSDTALTISASKRNILSEQERAATGGLTHKFSVSYSDIAFGSGTEDTVTLTLGNTPAKFIIKNSLTNVTTAFAGTTAMSIIVGVTGDTNAFIESQAITTAAVALTPTTTAGMNQMGAYPGTKGQSAVSMVATFTNSVGGSPSGLTAGALDIYVGILDLDDLP